MAQNKIIKTRNARVLKAQLSKIAADIKSLKIQGASKVENATIQAIKLFAKESSQEDKEIFLNELKELIIIFSTLRPTEPETRNFARYLLVKVMHQKFSDADEAKQKIISACDNYLKLKEEHKKKIIEFGVRMIDKNSVILTHCHSSSVEAVLKNAFEENKIKEIYCTETRPLFQGRITADNLSKIGLKVNHIVDSAVYSIMDKIDLFFSGCDAILSDGSLVNKIGTATISNVCDKFNVPHYVCTRSYKFDPITFFAFKEKIEQRNASEIWNKKNKNLNILNPAFDITPANSVQQYITEKGVFSPHVLPGILMDELGFQHDKLGLSLAVKLNEKNEKEK